MRARSVSVSGRCGWPLRRAVAGQIDRDGLPAAIGQQVEPAGLAPVVFG
jgi:hypothetical protein